MRNLEKNGSNLLAALAHKWQPNTPRASQKPHPSSFSLQQKELGALTDAATLPGCWVPSKVPYAPTLIALVILEKGTGVTFLKSPHAASVSEAWLYHYTNPSDVPFSMIPSRPSKGNQKGSYLKMMAPEPTLRPLWTVTSKVLPLWEIPRGY